MLPEKELRECLIGDLLVGHLFIGDHDVIEIPTTV